MLIIKKYRNDCNWLIMSYWSEKYFICLHVIIFSDYLQSEFQWVFLQVTPLLHYTINPVGGDKCFFYTIYSINSKYWFIQEQNKKTWWSFKSLNHSHNWFVPIHWFIRLWNQWLMSESLNHPLTHSAAEFCHCFILNYFHRWSKNRQSKWKFCV